MFVRKHGGLFKAVHAALDLDVNVIVWRDKFGNIVLGVDVGREVLVVKAHIFGFFHLRGFEKESFDIGGKQLGTSMCVRYCAVHD